MSWYKIQTTLLTDIILEYDGNREELCKGGAIMVKTPFHIQIKGVASKLVGTGTKSRQAQILPLWNFESDSANGEVVMNSSLVFMADLISDDDEMVVHAKQLINQISKARSEFIAHKAAKKEMTEDAVVLDKYLV